LSRRDVVEDLGDRIPEIQSFLNLIAAGIQLPHRASSGIELTEMRAKVAIDLMAEGGVIVVRGSVRASVEFELVWQLRTTD